MNTTFKMKPLLAGVLMMLAGVGSALAGESIYLCKQADGSETLSNLPEGGKCELLMAGTPQPAAPAVTGHAAARPADSNVALLARAMPAQPSGEGRAAVADDTADKEKDKEKDKDKQGKGDGSDSSWGSDVTAGRYGAYSFVPYGATPASGGASGGTATTDTAASGSGTGGSGTSGSATSGTTTTGTTTAGTTTAGTTTAGTASGGATTAGTAGGGTTSTASNTVVDTTTTASPGTQTASSGSSTPLDTKLQNVKALMVAAATNPGTGPAWVNSAVSRRYLMVDQATYRAMNGLPAVQ